MPSPFKRTWKSSLEETNVSGRNVLLTIALMILFVCRPGMDNNVRVVMLREPPSVESMESYERHELAH